MDVVKIKINPKKQTPQQNHQLKKQNKTQTKRSDQRPRRRYFKRPTKIKQPTQKNT